MEAWDSRPVTYTDGSTALQGGTPDDDDDDGANISPARSSTSPPAAVPQLGEGAQLSHPGGTLGQSGTKVRGCQSRPGAYVDSIFEL